MPVLGNNPNILGVDWLDQITNDNGILIIVAVVYLKFQNVIIFIIVQVYILNSLIVHQV